RAVYAAILAATLTWALRAGVDWDWEMPVVTLWVFALGGAVLASPAAAPSAAGEDAEPARRRRPQARLLRVVAGLGCLLLAVTPARVAISQKHVNESVSAFRHNDCGRAVSGALDSISAIGARPEPFEILGYCDVRLGAPALAVTAFERAVRRDPNNWELRYGLALARAADGRDPRAQARIALRLNPREPLAHDAVRAFRTRAPAQWRRRALMARLPRI
ncbi:MAG TPA: tetratricopeptide repeat protein, partial [Solirubrobacteraceae bacterium]